MGVPNTLHSRSDSSRALKSLWTIWCNVETYIFNSAIDAIGGLTVLLLFPMVSLYFVSTSNGVMFSSYGFPFLSLSAAALYDTYARFVSIKKDINENSRKVYVLKLFLRTALNVIAILLAAFICGVPSLNSIWWLPCIPLFCSGILIIVEVFRRIKNSFLLFGGV